MAEIPKLDLKIYPDVSDIFRAKERRRKELAKLPIEEKLAMAEKLRDAAKLLRTVRELRNNDPHSNSANLIREIKKR